MPPVPPSTETMPPTPNPEPHPTPRAPTSHLSGHSSQGDSQASSLPRECTTTFLLSGYWEYPPSSHTETSRDDHREAAHGCWKGSVSTMSALPPKTLPTGEHGILRSLISKYLWPINRHIALCFGKQRSMRALFCPPQHTQMWSLLVTQNSIHQGNTANPATLNLPGGPWLCPWDSSLDLSRPQGSHLHRKIQQHLLQRAALTVARWVDSVSTDACWEVLAGLRLIKTF